MSYKWLLLINALKGNIPALQHFLFFIFYFCLLSLVLKEMAKTNNSGQYPVSGVAWMSIIFLCDAASGIAVSPPRGLRGTHWITTNCSALCLES